MVARWDKLHADEADREQQDDRRDRDEDVVEPGQQSEMLFIRAGQLAACREMRAKPVCRIRAQSPLGNGFVEILLSEHFVSP